MASFCAAVKNELRDANVTDSWYYAEAGKPVGPLSLADLIAALSHVPNARNVLVWREGLLDWVEAVTVPDIVAHLVKPPPIPASPPHLPRPAADDVVPSKSSEGGEPSKNQQTRSVLKAGLIGLAVSVALTAVSTLSGKERTTIDPYWILNPEIIAYWVGKAGFLPLIFVVAIIAYSFRKTGLWKSALNLVGAVVGIVIVISVGVIVWAAVSARSLSE
jgi:hypothetical protein